MKFIFVLIFFPRFLFFDSHSYRCHGRYLKENIYTNWFEFPTYLRQPLRIRWCLNRIIIFIFLKIQCRKQWNSQFDEFWILRIDIGHRRNNNKNGCEFSRWLASQRTLTATKQLFFLFSVNFKYKQKILFSASATPFPSHRNPQSKKEYNNINKKQLPHMQILSCANAFNSSAHNRVCVHRSVFHSSVSRRCSDGNVCFLVSICLAPSGCWRIFSACHLYLCRNADDCVQNTNTIIIGTQAIRKYTIE